MAVPAVLTATVLARPFARLASLLALVPMLALAGCSGEEVAGYQPISDPAKLYLTLTYDYRAITMAAVPPYDTLQLMVTPRDARGEPIEELPAPTFRLELPGDSIALRVDSLTGRLTALQPVQGVHVIAELAAEGNVRHSDTATVNVTPELQELATFSIHPTDADSAVWPLNGVADSFAVLSYYATGFAGGDPRVQLRALDGAGNPLPSELLVEYRSLDPDTALVGQTGNVRPLREGHARLTAEAMVYGVARADTITATITAPVFIGIPVQADPRGPALFGTATRRVRANGFVMWMNALDRPVELVYTDPTNVVPAPTTVCDMTTMILGLLAGGGTAGCTGGSITLIKPDSATRGAIYRTVQVQQFSVPGTYDYHDAETGVTGRIVVTEVPTN